MGDRLNQERSEEGPKCPNPDCGSQFSADESFYYDEGNYDEDTCPDCGETFDVEVFTSTTWTTQRRATPS